jgi:DNA-binding protein H-NS
MARPKSLAAMSIDALLRMRDDIGTALVSKANALKKEMFAMGHDYAEAGRIAIYGKKKKSLAGTKVAPKYRGSKGELWAGRGATPVWMREAIKAGKTAEDFLIAKPTGAKKSAATKGKSGRPRRKRVSTKRAKKSPNNAKTRSSGATTYSYRI